MPRTHSPSPMRSASPDWDRDYAYNEECDASTAISPQGHNVLGGLINVAVDQASIGVGVQGRVGVKGVIRDRTEVEARTKLKQSRDPFDLS
jgi:hypothetical protein